MILVGEQDGEKKMLFSGREMANPIMWIFYFFANDFFGLLLEKPQKCEKGFCRILTKLEKSLGVRKHQSLIFSIN